MANVPQDGLTLVDTTGSSMQEGLSLANAPETVDTETALDRTPRYAYAMNVEHNDQAVADITDQLQRGQETHLRNQAAMAEENAGAQAKNEYLKQYVFDRAGEVTPQEVDTIMNLPNNRRVDPQIVMEKLYATRKANEIGSMPVQWDAPVADATNVPGTSYYDAASIENPAGAEHVMTRFEAVVAQQQVDRKIGEEVQREVKNQSWAGLGKDLALDAFVPFWSWYHTTDAGKSFMAGGNWNEKLQELKSIHDPKEYEDAVRAWLAPMDAVSKMQAVQGLNHWTSSDQFWKSFETGSDVAAAAGFGLPKALKILTGLGITLAVGAASLAVKFPSTARTLDKLGLMSDAAHARAIAIADERAAATGQSFDEIKSQAVSIYDTNAVLSGGDTLMSNTKLQRLQIMLQTNAAKLLRASMDNVPVDRLSRNSTALAEGYKAAELDIRSMYTRINDSVIDISAIPKDDTLNVDAIKVEVGQRRGTQLNVTASKKKGQKTQPIAVSMGQTGADLFPNAVRADRYAREDIGLAKGSYTIEDRGNGKFIQIIKQVPEIADTVRDSLTIETNAKTPRSLGWWRMDWLKNPDSTMSKEFIKEAKAIYGLTSTIYALKYATRDIANLTGGGGLIKQTISKAILGDREWQRFNKFVSGQRDFVNPVDGTRGRFSTNLGEFGSDWQGQFGRLPTERETRAYWAYKQVNDIDYANYNVNLWQAKVRLGMMNIGLPYEKNMMGMQAVKGFAQAEARYLKDGLPWALKEKDPTAGILLWEKDQKTGQMKRYSFKYDAKEGDMTAMIKQKGLHVFQMTPYGEQALRDVPELKDVIPKGQINFILTKEHNSAPLSLRQIPYQPGGHVEYASGWFIRQPQLSKAKNATTYYGDVNIRGGHVEADAKMYAGRYDEGRRLLKAHEDAVATLAGEKKKVRNIRGVNLATLDVAAKRAAVEAHLQKNLPEDFTTFRRYFVGDNARLDLDTPIYATRKGENTADVAAQGNNIGLRNFKDSLGKPVYPGFRQAKDSPFNLYNQNIDLRFGLEKNEPIYRVVNEGDTLNPLYKVKPARTVDPSVAMDSSARYLMRGRYLADFKIKAAEQYIQEFGHFYKDVSKDEMRTDPMKWMYRDIPSGSGRDWRAAKAFQRTAKEFMNIKNDDERQMMWFRNAMLEKAMGFNENLGVALEPYLLHKIKDPVHYMRSTAFHLKMLAPHQLFLQASSVMHAMSISGFQNAAVGTMISTYMRALKFTDDPAIIAKVARAAEELWGIKAAHFTESYIGMQRAGILRVGHEVGQSGAYFDPAIIQTGVGKVLDGGRWFFNEGERIARSASWSIAYKEWRAANPLADFTDDAIKTVRKRTDMFMGNMTAQNNAMWQKGWAGIPTQFWGYPVRVAEQFLGKRLTGEERRRMFLTYGVMYGWPNSINLAMPFWPMSESIKSTLFENGIDTDSNVVSRVLTQGLGSYMTEQLLGEEYNVSERYGLGMPILRDLIHGNKNVFEAFGGASGTAIADMLAHSMPLLYSFTSMINPDGKEYPMTWYDAMDMMGEQSAANNARKAYQAVNYGHYFSKQGREITDMTGTEGVIGFFSGLLPERVNDQFLLSDNGKQRDKFNKQIMQEAETWIQRSLQTDNTEEQVRYRERAAWLLNSTDLTTGQRSAFIQQALRGRYSMVQELFTKEQNDPNPERQKILIDRIRGIKK